MSTAEQVFEAIQDLHTQEQVVTRDVLAEHTGLPLTTIDDRVSHLIDNGRVIRVQRGVFVPVMETKPARIISRTLLPDGSSVLEVGDDSVLVLTARECRMLGEIFAGSGQQFAAIELGRQANEVTGDLGRRIKAVQRTIGSLSKKPTQPVGG